MNPVCYLMASARAWNGPTVRDAAPFGITPRAYAARPSTRAYFQFLLPISLRGHLYDGCVTASRPRYAGRFVPRARRLADPLRSCPHRAGKTTERPHGRLSNSNFPGGPGRGRFSGACSDPPSAERSR